MTTPLRASASYEFRLVLTVSILSLGMSVDARGAEKPAHNPLITFSITDAIDNEHTIRYGKAATDDYLGGVGSSLASHSSESFGKIVSGQYDSQFPGVLMRVDTGVFACIPWYAINEVVWKQSSTHIASLTDGSTISGDLLGCFEFLMEPRAKFDSAGVQSLRVDMDAKDRASIKAYQEVKLVPSACKILYGQKTYGSFRGLKLARVYSASSRQFQGILIVGTTTSTEVDWRQDFVIVQHGQHLGATLGNFKGRLVLSMKSKDRVQIDVTTAAGRKIAGDFAFSATEPASDELALRAYMANGVQYAFQLKAGDITIEPAAATSDAK